MNSINLTGRLTKDPELKTKASGDGSYTFFCLAVDDGKDKEGKKLTNFIDCIAYNQQASFLCNYAKKGDLIELSGKLHVSNREDEQGNKTKRTTVIAFNVGICSSKRDQAAKPETVAPARPETVAPARTVELSLEPTEAVYGSELPFEL